MPSRTLVTKPAGPRYDAASLRKRGQGRAGELPRRLGLDPGTLRGKRILEIGCGFGESTVAVRDMYGADAVGIDPFPRFRRGPWADEALFRDLDVTAADPDELGRFDFIHSYTVWEHIERPKAALRKVHELLNEGGRAYLWYNLHRGASAAHLMHYLDFPWIHLIHTDQEIRGMMLERHGIDRGPSWVNKLTWAHYLQYFPALGFEVEAVWYDRFEMPTEFYRAHQAKLKPYPKEDLERNFMHARLLKPVG